MSKTQVEECCRLSINVFKRHLHPGFVSTVTWQRSDQSTDCIACRIIGARVPTAIRLIYTITQQGGETEEYDYRVGLTTTPLPWGGERYWFLCPFWECDRRVAYLYMAPGRPFFACRQCHNLNYESQRRHNVLGKLLRQIDARTNVP
jgi:hypothetical protein